MKDQPKTIYEEKLENIHGEIEKTLDNLRSKNVLKIATILEKLKQNKL